MVKDTSSGEEISDISIMMASKPLTEVIGKRPFHVICEFSGGQVKMMTKVGQ